MITTFYVTHKGANYITRAMTDRALVFTRGEFGNGLPPDGTSPLAMTSLANKLGPLPISKKSNEQNSLIVTTQFSNKVNGQILPGFKLTEVGLYGRLQTYDGKNDPEGPETLLFYGYTTEDKADYIDTVLTEFLLNFPLTTSGDATINVIIDESIVYPTIEEFNEFHDMVEKILSFVMENVLLTRDMFSADQTYLDYPYKAVLTIEGVTEKSIADVVFAPLQAEAGIFAGVAATSENTLTLYARSIPAEDIIIPTIEFRHAGGGLDDDGGSGGGGIDSDDVATDEEVEDAIDDVFGPGSGDDSGEGGGVTDDDVATDEEVGDIIDDIFGDGSSDDAGGNEPGGDDTGGDDVATDEEVKDVIDDVFGPESGGEDAGGSDTPEGGENTGGGESGGSEGDSTGGDDAGNGGGTEDPGEEDDNIATDEEVGDIIEDIFGSN